MTRIDFYVLPDEDARKRLVYACKLVDKAFALGHRVHIHTADAIVAQALDDLLWSFRDGSFIPHAIDPEQPADYAVSIGHQREPSTDRQVLVNLAADLPLFFSRFERVAEIVNQEPAVRDAGRERWRFYRDRGYELHHHEVTG
ncbi:MAG: DNA polymerase III subunit chi [Ectothiorhodospiraceae bacterium]|jgi:DNA polymerase-3 subunit chi|nr:DNA polymerase III subunit chi [Ectothiorhodospiraceae bacterium]